MGTAHLLLTDPEITQEQIEFVRIIYSSAEMLLTDINAILDFGSLKSRSIELEMIPFDIPTLVCECLDRLSDQITNKEIDVDVTVDPSCTGVFTDRGRLMQILDATLKNALNFTKKGKITIRVEPQSMGSDTEFIYFSIADSGIG